jgi:hypothetical protein
MGGGAGTYYRLDILEELPGCTISAEVSRMRGKQSHEKGHPRLQEQKGHLKLQEQCVGRLKRGHLGSWKRSSGLGCRKQEME